MLNVQTYLKRLKIFQNNNFSCILEKKVVFSLSLSLIKNIFLKLFGYDCFIDNYKWSLWGNMKQMWVLSMIRPYFCHSFEVMQGSCNLISRLHLWTEIFIYISIYWNYIEGFLSVVSMATMTYHLLLFLCPSSFWVILAPTNNENLES